MNKIYPDAASALDGLLFDGMLIAAGWMVSTLALDPPPARGTHTTPDGITYANGPPPRWHSVLTEIDPARAFSKG